jgi:cell wall-associated NlpC family hydrolase
LLYSSLDDTDIENILSGVLSANPDVTDEQLATLAYALSKVGCEYDQAYHGNTDVDIFDCSSLVYRAYQEAGVDISNSGIYTAAEECRALMSSGNTVTGDLQPGDLIFYGGSDNGRYLGIYHVAIYVGNVDGVDKMVEARDTDSGVVYCDLRGSNVVNVSRPTA